MHSAAKRSSQKTTRLKQPFKKHALYKVVTVLEFLYERVLAYLAAAAMFAMMTLTFVDVVGRYLFSSPLGGGFEITEFLLATLIFLGLPMVTAANGHIDVDLLDSAIPDWLKPIQNIVICLVNILAFGVLSWMLWRLALRSYEYQDTTAILEIPFAGLVLLMALCCALSTITLVIMLFLTRGKNLFQHNRSVSENAAPVNLD